MKVLEVSHHQVKVQNRLLIADLSFSLNSGEILAIIGSSGIGKTTLLKEIAFAHQHPSVSIKKLTESVYQPQELALSEELTAETNVKLALLNPQISFFENLKLDQEQKIQSMLVRLGLSSLPQKPVKKYSGGEKQRIALARSLLHRAPLLLLDEPISQLDPERADQVMEVISQECKNKQRAAVIILHDWSLAKKYADRILQLQENSWELL
ncbi:MAG: ATP-binding cassette domain-containing protein [Bdellovibrionia bacterium]